MQQTAHTPRAAIDLQQLQHNHQAGMLDWSTVTWWHSWWPWGSHSREPHELHWRQATRVHSPRQVLLTCCCITVLARQAQLRCLVGLHIPCVPCTTTLQLLHAPRQHLLSSFTEISCTQLLSVAMSGGAQLSLAGRASDSSAGVQTAGLAATFSST